MMLTNRLFALGLLLLLLAAGSASSAPAIRAVLDGDLTFADMEADWTSTSDSVTVHQLAMMRYYKKLGYTHVYYSVFWFGRMPTFNNGRWDLDNGNCTTGTCANNFRRMKAALESNGLKMIPLFADLTHMDPYIRSDTSLGEFTSASFAKYCKQGRHNGDRIPDDPRFNQIAFIGNYPGVKNAGADRLFGLGLAIVKANWGHSAPGGACPALIHIGHDENGYGTACLIAEGKGRSLLDGSTSRADLVAREIAFRFQQIQDSLSAMRGGTVVKVMFWSDSYEPADAGQMYGLCGDPVSGKGGVLYKLKYDKYIQTWFPLSFPVLAPNLIVQPWSFSGVDGSFRAGFSPESRNAGDCRFNKVVILNYLSNLGYQYIPLAGEDGDNDARQSCSVDAQWVAKVKRTTYEWVHASLMFPGKCAGYSFASWIQRYRGFANGKHAPNPAYFANVNDSTALEACFGACLLAYAGWAFPDRSYVLARNTYTPQFFSSCNYRQSRNNLSWKRGTDYQPFALPLAPGSVTDIPW